MVETDIPPPYEEQEYLQKREAALNIIPKSNFLSAISRNSATIFSALAMAAVAAIVAGVVQIPLWGTMALIGGALATAAVSTYAGYRDEAMSKSVGMSYNEANQVAQACLNGRELAKALQETMGQEMNDIKEENQKTRQVVAALEQKMSRWQDREAVKAVKEETPPRTLQ